MPAQRTSTSTIGTVSAIMDAVVGEKECKGEHQTRATDLDLVEGKAGLRVVVPACSRVPKVSRLAAAYQAVKHDRSQKASYAP
jgi:hypothetical protein